MNLKGRNKVSPDFQMSSMTDIVFLLLIFFMLTSTLVTNNALDLVLPKSGGKTAKSQVVSVSITKDLKYYVDKDQIPFKGLERELQVRLRNEDKPAIIIRAEKSVDVDHLVQVLDIARRNKYKTTLATQPK